MRRSLLVAAGLAAGLISIGATRFGGWAVVTVEQPPEYLVVGKATPLTFAVRQHGMNLLTGLSPYVDARAGSREIRWRAVPVVGGRYRANVVVPAAGDWQITIQSGFGKSRGNLLPIRAVDSAAAPPTPFGAYERGRMLFAAKGCITCHVHGGADVRGEVSDFGPNLTSKRFAASYLEDFLRDPSIKPPNPESGARMPKPDLRTADIGPIVAFLNAERRTAGK